MPGQYSPTKLAEIRAAEERANAPTHVTSTNKVAKAMWRVQTTLHGKSNNIALPALIVSAAIAMFIYKHFTDSSGGDPIKHFLGLIVIQMMPLVFLQKKILSTPDPVAMLSHFGTKVLLMHACFLILRVVAWPLLEVGLGLCNLIGLSVVVVALRWGFRFRSTDILAHWDICGLLLIAMAGALCTELLDFNRQAGLLESTIFTASSYMEILSFVPAVWTVYQSVKKTDDVYKSAAAKYEAGFFFLFLVPFYVMEDVISAFRVGGEEPLAAVGHIVHFLLVLDFACFLLSHIYNPDKAQCRVLGWLPL